MPCSPFVMRHVSKRTLRALRTWEPLAWRAFRRGIFSSVACAIPFRAHPDRIPSRTAEVVDP